MFEKAKFSRINAIFDKPIGPRFIPQGYVKVRDALAIIGVERVPLWTGDEMNEDKWHDEAKQETQEFVRWRNAAEIFLQELFAENIQASYLDFDGKLVALPGSTFAQDQMENIFRIHQEYGKLYFVPSKELEMLSPLRKSETANQRHLTLELSSKKSEKPTDGDMANFFLKTISGWSDDKRPPNKDEWYSLHRNTFKERALTSIEFHAIRARPGKAEVLPLYLRKSGNRQPGWRRNIPHDWQKRFGWL